MGSTYALVQTRHMRRLEATMCTSFQPLSCVQSLRVTPALSQVRVCSCTHRRNVQLSCQDVNAACAVLCAAASRLLQVAGIGCRFDGDAMIHAVRFADGKALSYQNHWLRTPRFLVEQQSGHDGSGRVHVSCFDCFWWRCAVPPACNMCTEARCLKAGGSAASSHFRAITRSH